MNSLILTALDGERVYLSPAHVVGWGAAELDTPQGKRIGSVVGLVTGVGRPVRESAEQVDFLWAQAMNAVTSPSNTQKPRAARAGQPA